MTTLTLRDLGFVASSGNRQLWTPANITTLLWLDASDSNSVITVGNDVSQWNDKSGNLYNFSQTGTPRPKSGLRTLGGLNVLDFNGTSHFLSRSNSGTSASNVSCFMVYDADSSAAALSYLLDFQTGRLIFANTVDSGNGSRGPAIFDGTWRGVDSRQSGAQIISWVMSSSGNGAIYRSDTAIVENLPFTQRAFNGSIAIARHSSTTASFFNGGIGEIILINATVSADDRQLINGYLHWKWGLVSNLPNDHPYKNSPPTV